MEEYKQKHGWASFLSGLCVFGALALLVWVCSRCYPGIEDRIRQVLGGLESSPARQAFSTLADGLESGVPIGQTVAEAAQVLFGTPS